MYLKAPRAPHAGNSETSLSLSFVFRPSSDCSVSRSGSSPVQDTNCSFIRKSQEVLYHCLAAIIPKFRMQAPNPKFPSCASRTPTIYHNYAIFLGLEISLPEHFALIFKNQTRCTSLPCFHQVLRL